MQKGYLISVIIPVYNTREYLRPCLDSVICQRCFERCEVLLVNDGSTDGSGEVLAEYASRYPNMRVLTHDSPPWNRGLSAARNCGLRAVSGEYVFFLDSDDMLNEDYLEKLLSAAEDTESEIVYAGFSKWTNGQAEPVKRKVLESVEVMTGSGYLARREDLEDEQNYVWDGLYRTEFLRGKRLCFEEEVRLFEDVVFSWEAALAAERISTLENYGYYYRQRAGSLVHREFSAADMDDFYCGIEKMCRKARENRVPREAIRFFYSVIGMYLYFIGSMGEKGILDAAARKGYYRKLSALTDWKSLWKAAGNAKERLKWCIWRLNWGLYYPLVRKDGV